MPIRNVMNLPPEILQFVASLAAILILAGIAHALRLGQPVRLAGEAEIRHAAGEAVDGYDPVQWAVDRGGNCAILRDADGRLLLLKPHGNKFAGRLLGPGAHAQAGAAGLIVASGERRYGSATLRIDEPAAWAEAINRLGSPGHA